MIDKEGRKQGYWIYYGKDRPEAGFPENGIIEEGRYVDNRKEGVWLKYHRDGKTIKLLGNYKNNRPSGEYETYHTNGKVKRKGCFVRGRIPENCTEYWYYESGVLESKRTTDSTINYYENGCLMSISTTASNDLSRTRIIQFKQDDCNVIKDTVYEFANLCKGIIVERTNCSIRKGDSLISVNYKEIDEFYKTPPPVISAKTKGTPFKPNDYNKVYNENDEVWQDGEFINGSLWDGKVYVYDSDGILLKVLIYKEGKYHADGQL